MTLKDKPLYQASIRKKII